MAWFHRNGPQALQEIKFYYNKTSLILPLKGPTVSPRQEEAFCTGRWEADKGLTWVACVDLVKNQSSLRSWESIALLTKDSKGGEGPSTHSRIPTPGKPTACLARLAGYFVICSQMHSQWERGSPLLVPLNSHHSSWGLEQRTAPRARLVKYMKESVTDIVVVFHYG